MNTFQRQLYYERRQTEYKPREQSKAILGLSNWPTDNSLLGTNRKLVPVHMLSQIRACWQTAFSDKMSCADWGFVLAGISDSQKPAELLSPNMTGGMTSTVFVHTVTLL